MSYPFYMGPCLGPSSTLSNEFEDSADFMMWCFKVEMCTREDNHDWSQCPWAHKNEKSRRRDPSSHKYSSIACPDTSQGAPCPRGNACLFTHNLYEYWLHPDRFRTQMCKLGPRCTRPLCFFAHRVDELRFPEMRYADGADSSAPLSAAPSAVSAPGQSAAAATIIATPPSPNNNGSPTSNGAASPNRPCGHGKQAAATATPVSAGGVWSSAPLMPQDLDLPPGLSGSYPDIQPPAAAAPAPAECAGAAVPRPALDEQQLALRLCRAECEQRQLALAQQLQQLRLREASIGSALRSIDTIGASANGGVPRQLLSSCLPSIPITIAPDQLDPSDQIM